MPSYQVKEKSASLEMTINPLVNWIWLGFAVMAIGTGIVLLPERTFSFAMAKFPAPEAATTTTALLLMLLLASPAFAQSGSVPLTPTDPLEKRLHSEIVCTCGCRRALDNCGMPNCGGHTAQSEKIKQLMAEGKDHDAIVATFIRDFGGQDILIEPNDKGLNRFAWAFPYAIAGFGAVAGVFAIRKWSRRSSEQPRLAVAAPVGDAALQARLDRELENLD